MADMEQQVEKERRENDAKLFQQTDDFRVPENAYEEEEQPRTEEMDIDSPAKEKDRANDSDQIMDKASHNRKHKD